jgi:hypothetical protein
MQKTIQSRPQSISIKEEVPKEITITIAYDEKSAGQRAARLLSSISQEQAGQLRIAVQPWRFDLLADTDWQRFAAAEALQADILVIAMSNPGNLSAAVEEWFTTWLNCKRGFHAAVIALVETESEADSSHSPELQFLESATKQAGLDFFTPRPDHSERRWRDISVATPAFSYRKPYHHWGINE